MTGLATSNQSVSAAIAPENNKTIKGNGAGLSLDLKLIHTTLQFYPADHWNIIELLIFAAIRAHCKVTRHTSNHTTMKITSTILLTHKACFEQEAEKRLINTMIDGSVFESVQLIQTSIDRNVADEVINIVIFGGKLLIKFKHLLSEIRITFTYIGAIYS